MSKSSQIMGKILYGSIFLALLPIGLFIWARYSEYLVSVPAIHQPFLGWILIAAGGALMIWGMLVLMIQGKGMPMNAYPPANFVESGPFRIVSHPIYAGFSICMLGVFIVDESASGIWLVTPILILGIIALVLGYEKNKLTERFPGQSLSPLFHIPDASSKHGSLKNRLASLMQVSLLLLLCNFIVKTFSQGVSPAIGGTPLALPVMHRPVFLWFAFLSVSIVPFLLREKRHIRLWMIASVIGLAMSTYLGLLTPPYGAQFLYETASFWISVPLFMFFISTYYTWKFARLKGLWFVCFAVICPAIVLINCKSAVMNVFSGVPVFLIAVNHQAIWGLLRSAAERIANSWKEWTFGNVRIINHGFYVGFAAFFGILFSGILAGTLYAWSILVFAITVIVFSALWAQVIEGSEKLKRPFGYYGALVGILIASMIVWAMGSNVWVVIGVISVSMPWVQAIGRLRCLINGCCHGKRTNHPELGIRYFHFRSRVCNISLLKGKLLHPTPLYAILWLGLVGFVLLAFWYNHFPPPFIFGMYLILTGIGRFVEEAFRGEVQTPFLGGLRLYQWTALLSVLIGIFMTTIQISPVITFPGIHLDTLIAAFIGGVFTFIAMGVDFPKSNARFSRLV